MADYIYTLEIRLTPDQQRGVTLVQDAARAAGMNVYLTGGAVRDIISGFTIRDLDFTVHAMALSLNPGSRGLLMDPYNGAADIEAKLLRVLHNYAFVEDPSRLIRASRFAARFHWPLEERTQQRYDSAKENNYIEYISDRAIGYEIEQLA